MSSSVDYDALVETLTHALHSTETAQGWYGAPECAEVGRVLAPHVQALLAQAWAEGWRAYLDRKKLVDDNPYRTSVLPPGHGVEDVDDFLTAYDNQPGIETTVLPPGIGDTNA